MNVLVPILERTEELYRDSEEESFLTDAQYDILYRQAEKLDPFHKIFVGEGSDERGDKIALPIAMPGLAQIYSADQNDGISTVAKWVDDHNLKNADIVVMGKLDGQSVLHISDENGLQIAFSKSELQAGRDITRHVKKMKKTANTHEKMAIRAEAVFEYKLFPSVKEDILKHGGREYKNPRNFVAGMNNSTTAHDLYYKNVDLVAYEIMGSKLSKVEQLKTLKNAGWLVPDYWVFKGKDLNDEMLKKLIVQAKAQSKFELDGVVLVVDSHKIRESMSQSSSGSPEHSRKFKISDNAAITEVVDVIWGASKQGYANPRVQLKPVELAGVTITYASGYNAKNIIDMGIGPGAVVKLTRAGDVIPKILETIKKVKPKLPGKEFGEVYWSDNNVDLILVNVEENDEVRINSLIDAFDRLEIAALREASVQKLYDAGIDTVAKIIKAKKQQFVELIGAANGTKIYESLHKKLANVDPAVLAAASQCFGRGIGVRRMTKIFQEHGKIQGLTREQILTVETFSDITANLVVNGLVKYEKFLKEINGFYNFEKKEVVMGGDLEGCTFVFTGYRNKDAEKEIESRGGKIGTSVSSKATHLVMKDIFSTSGKAVKARELGLKLLSPADLDELLR
jgi:DNA ligase (NAD+)